MPTPWWFIWHWNCRWERKSNFLPLLQQCANALQRMYGDFLPSLGSPFILYSSSAPANKPFRVADGWTPSD